MSFFKGIFNHSFLYHHFNIFAFLHAFVFDDAFLNDRNLGKCMTCLFLRLRSVLTTLNFATSDGHGHCSGKSHLPSQSSWNQSRGESYWVPTQLYSNSAYLRDMCKMDMVVYMKLCSALFGSWEACKRREWVILEGVFAVDTMWDSKLAVLLCFMSTKEEEKSSVVLLQALQIKPGQV